MNTPNIYLLAEAGATSVDWFLFNRDGVVDTFKSAGINPETMQSGSLLANIGAELVDWLGSRAIAKAYYYGAGLGNPAFQLAITEWLRDLFPETYVEAGHDLLAAARAACGSQTGLVAILGTGSIAARWDGQTVVERRGGQGWLFGDEGSGAWLGKMLLKAALDGELDPETVQKIEDFAGMPLLDIRKTVYQSEKPGAKMAEFARFVGENRSIPAVNRMVMRGLGEFVEKTMLPLQVDGLSAHFVGSVAEAFAPELRNICANAALPVACIVPRPGEMLVKWHQKSL